ncbi:radical SAM/SPASM domain-containing protein [Candidatus Entotheonella palauensis]|uniref:radical SAM/SPASM domain-containing protein n=1 Tax=Candidatus Entotheonella palauensis TaxID=93172 RepID=UPI000B7F24A2|nr:radical SAM protein [Candidatus Entotheonella palauensis]
MSRVELPVLNTGTSPAGRGDLSSSPRHPALHVFDTALGPHVLLVNGSRLYQISESLARSLRQAMTDSDPQAVEGLLNQHHLNAPAYIDNQPPESFSVRALSLAVSQACNLGCTYCYAEGGSFGGTAKNMTREVAFAAVERLLADVNPGEKANLSFLGGEPLINRQVLYRTTECAAQRARDKGVRLGFSITTNGTLITEADGAFFERFGFAVTVSLDGVGEIHDQLRSFKNGRGSYDQIVQRVKPLLAMQRNMQVSARVTVTPQNLHLQETLDELIRLGFHSVGFSPMLSSPTGLGEMQNQELDTMLDRMVDCGHVFEREILAGHRYPFSNMVNAMHELHKGTHRPYPCGAGAGYFGVSADGELFACHRFVDNASGAMGNLGDGVASDIQATWLAQRHVHRQEPCQRCWARYLCGGGCHHESIHRGRPACDYIRGWLHYCLQAYANLLTHRPDYFGLPTAT